MNEEVFVEEYEKRLLCEKLSLPSYLQEIWDNKEESEERDENPFYKFIRAIFEKCCPDGTKRYYECRS